MGHVINPISFRVDHTTVSDLNWNVRSHYCYSYVLFKTRSVVQYMQRLFSHPSLKYSWLLNSSKIICLNSTYYSLTSLYSHTVFVPLSTIYDHRSLQKLSLRKRFSIRWLLFLIVRNFYLYTSFYWLKLLVERDLLFIFGLPIRQTFIFLSQNALSAQSWAYFIRNKLKKNTEFRSIMYQVIPILNQMLYNKNILLGYKITCSGRTSRRGRASFSIRSRGNLPLSTIISFVSYAFCTVVLKNSICGIKVWLFFKKQPKIFNSYKSYIL